MTAARIHLLGRFAVERGDGEHCLSTIPASAWRKRRPVELLTAVALARGRTLHREEVIDRLWPDKDLDAGANNLHRALYDLRQIVGMELVGIDRGVVRLVDGVWVDVEAFERAAAAGTVEGRAKAVELYAGDLLPDDPYSDATSARREELRQRFVDAALELARESHASGERDACVAVLRRVLAVDKALEPAHRLLMRVLAESGRAVDAMRQFAECTVALRERLDSEPSAETLALRRAIEAGEVQPPASPPVPAPTRRAEPGLFVQRLLGRDAMRAIHGREEALASIRRRVTAGRGVLLLIGEAGLGKTRLAAECARWASAAGATVLVGLGSELGAAVPYAPFVDAWSNHRRHAPEAVDPFASFTPSGGSAQEDRFRLFRTIERSIEALAEGAGLCLVVEDLHQADESSLHLFHHLARATRSRPLLLVGTLREEAVRVGTGVHTLVGTLAREHLAQRILLERLDLDAISGLVGDVVGGSHGAALAPAVHALAEGNPFYAEEVARAMRDHEGSQPAPPAGLLETVRHRVRSLGRDAERLFVAAAVTGHRFAFETARVAAGLEPGPALDALELGIEARVVEEGDGDYRFRHALVQRALLEGVTHARRVYLHRALAAALEAAACGETSAALAHAEALAHHHEAAGQLDRAIPYLLAAAERAQKHLGFSEAVLFLERARELMDALGVPASPERFQVLRAMGGMKMALSDLDAAVADLDAAASLEEASWRPSPPEIAIARRVAALALIQAGRLDEAQARLEEALAIVGDTRSSELCAVLYLFAQLRWHQGRFVEARDLAARALGEASARDDRQAMAKGHEMMALAFHSLGEWNEGREHEAKRQELADGSLDVDQAFDVHLCLWEYHLYGDRSASETRAAVAQTLEQARRMGAPRAIALCHCFAGAIDFQTGRWKDAEEELREGVTLFRQIGSACGESLSLQRLGVLLTARGEIDEARSTLDDALAVGERAAMRSHCLTRVHASLTRNRLAASDLEGARESLRAGLAEAERHGHCATCNSLLLPEAVRVELAFGAVREAAAFSSRLQDVAARFGSRAWTAMAMHARARVDAARGKTEAAASAFEQARRAFAEVGYRYDVARCQLAESRVASADASKLEEEARRALSELGATAAEA